MGQKCCDYDAITHYASGAFSGRYKTKLDGKLKRCTAPPLPDTLAQSFEQGIYHAYQTLEEIVLYRAFGLYQKNNSEIVGAWSGGAFASTEFAESIIDVKMRLALAPEWFNTKMYEEKILVPVGQVLYVGKVAPVQLKTGTWLPGGADQLILPKQWPPEWVLGYRRITSRQLQQIPAYRPGQVPPAANKSSAYSHICPYCGSEHIRKLNPEERFSIIGCKGNKYVMKSVCEEPNCGYYW